MTVKSDFGLPYSGRKVAGSAMGGGTISRRANDDSRAERVNRTHRVVRERAKTLADRRSRMRSLWLPMLLLSTLLIVICIAVWTVLHDYDVAPSGTQANSYQSMVPLLWSIPVSVALLAVVWFRQSRSDTETRREY